MNSHVPAADDPPEDSGSPAAEWLPAALPGPVCWRSEQLLAGGREAHIQHQGAVYRLQLTSLGKLILTK